MIEATFTKCRLNATFDVASSVSGPQIQRLTAQSEPSTVVHVQCGFNASMYTTSFIFDSVFDR